MGWNNRLLLALSVLVSLFGSGTSVLQTEEIDVYLGDSMDAPSYSLYVAGANFGAFLEMGPEQNDFMSLTTPPSSNPLLCKNETFTTQPHYGSRPIMLVPRGECSFLIKAWNAQRLGAKAVLVHGSLASRYTLNTTDHDDSYQYTQDDIVWPSEFYDYDCNKGRAWIPASPISLDPLPYNAEVNDALLSGSTVQNLCKSYMEQDGSDSTATCPSQACLLTGKRETPEGDAKMEACCAWDLAMWLYAEPNATKALPVDIPAGYVTMEQGNQLLQDLEAGRVSIVYYERQRSSYQMSSILIWALGVAVAALAAYLSAGEYHYWIQKTLKRSASRGSDDRSSHGRAPRSEPRRQASQEEQLELTPMHALGFIVLASTSLFILFYFKIYNFVKFMYAIGCSKAVSQVLFYPLIRNLMKRAGHRNVIVWRTGTVDFGDLTFCDIASHVCGYALGIAWIVVACVNRHPEELVFFWVTQNVFGACMCIMFAQVIKLNSIRVASILLIIAFFYDIFFVFITPLLFDKSIMITVATSGGPPTADPAWCEKYPDDADCQGGDPLPMLLTIPRFGDYQGGASLLGLGDIVLPGLLLSFAARYDAAKILVGLRGGGNGSLTAYNCAEQKFCSNCCTGGYFPPLVIAYAVGLMMANLAVALMNMGQPALLYLVPCCLGTMSWMGWRRGELTDLWEGPKIVRTADELVYGVDQQPTGHAALPTEDGQDALEVPSAEDGDDDNMQALMNETNP